MLYNGLDVGRADLVENDSYLNAIQGRRIWSNCGVAHSNQSNLKLILAETIRRKEMKKLLAVVMALAFALGCVSFAAAADTTAGDTGQTVTKKKKKAAKKKATKKKVKKSADTMAPTSTTR